MEEKKALVAEDNSEHYERYAALLSGMGLRVERACDGVDALAMAKAGKYDGYLLEGMACPGGCVAGAGTIQPIAKSAASVAKHKAVSTNAHAQQSDYKDILELLEK